MPPPSNARRPSFEPYPQTDHQSWSSQSRERSRSRSPSPMATRRSSRRLSRSRSRSRSSSRARSITPRPSSRSSTRSESLSRRSSVRVNDRRQSGDARLCGDEWAKMSAHGDHSRTYRLRSEDGVKFIGCQERAVLPFDVHIQLEDLPSFSLFAKM